MRKHAITHAWKSFLGHFIKNKPKTEDYWYNIAYVDKDKVVVASNEPANASKEPPIYKDRGLGQSAISSNEVDKWWEVLGETAREPHQSVLSGILDTSTDGESNLDNKPKTQHSPDCFELEQKTESAKIEQNQNKVSGKAGKTYYDTSGPTRLDRVTDAHSAMLADLSIRILVLKSSIDHFRGETGINLEELTTDIVSSTKTIAGQEARISKLEAKPKSKATKSKQTAKSKRGKA
jgi:hypothetical protein